MLETLFFNLPVFTEMAEEQVVAGSHSRTKTTLAP
jgi:hypothetical protein